MNLCLIFQVGRALGPSILDLSNSNPSSRLQNSEFHTLQGLRNALRTEIDKKISQNLIPSKVSTLGGKKKKIVATWDDIIKYSI